jgi:anti-anti-sigma factor
MNITTREYKRAMVIRVTGRVDANTAPQFDETLKRHIDGGSHHLVVEMDATEYLSSAGVRALISARKALKPKGGDIFIAQPSERVKEVLHLAGMESLFQTFDTTEAAVGAV